jgi:hypothetical protein
MNQRSHVLIAAGGCVAAVLGIVLLVRTKSAAGPEPVVNVPGIRSDPSEIAGVATSNLEKPEAIGREATPPAPSEPSVAPELAQLAGSRGSLERLLNDEHSSIRNLLQEAELQDIVARARQVVEKSNANAGQVVPTNASSGASPDKSFGSLARFLADSSDPRDVQDMSDRVEVLIRKLHAAETKREGP